MEHETTRMKAKQVILMVGLLIGSAPFLEATAQMYRCGNVYQDRPCDSGAGKQVTGAGANTPQPAANANRPANTTYPECGQRGVDAQKIVWAREAGETEEKLSASETNPARRKLISDVYRVRGTVVQVRTRIESECQVEMAEKAKAIALHESMVRAGVMPAQRTDTTNTQSAAEREAAAAQRAQSVAQNEAAAKKSKCDRLQASRTSILGQQRSGGSASYMDSLNRQRASVDRELQENGCSSF
jgi:hypothetical protein